VTLEKYRRISDTLSHLARSSHLASRWWGGLLAPAVALEPQRCEQPTWPWCIQLQNTTLLSGAPVLTPPHRPRRQRRLANRDWMPASYTSGQPSHPRRHPTCWASSQWSRTVSSTLCRGAWIFAPLSGHLSIECRYTTPQITHLYPPHNNSSVYLTTTTYVRRTGRITNAMWTPTPLRNDPAKNSLVSAW